MRTRRQPAACAAVSMAVSSASPMRRNRGLVGWRGRGIDSVRSSAHSASDQTLDESAQSPARRHAVSSIINAQCYIARKSSIGPLERAASDLVEAIVEQANVVHRLRQL